MKNITATIIAGTVIFGFILSNNSFAQDDKSYLDPPQLIKDPSSTKEYLVENRTGSGVPSLAVSRNDRLWAVWYVGTTPETIIERCPNNYVVVATSYDQGETWEEVLLIDPDGPGPVRAFDPQVWIDPNGQLWVFWAQEIREYREISSKEGKPYGVWAITTVDADENDPLWSNPRRISEGIMMNKPTVLSSGEWVLPVSIWRIKDGAKAVVSNDNGKNWYVRGAVNVPESVWSADESMIVERKDGSLWMLVRTSYGIGESISSDRGRTWTSLIPSKIQHGTARFFISRLHSGNLLLVKHGPIDMRIGRSHLMAFISKDDGHSWSDGLLLDGRRITYPDGQQTADGTIYITYDHGRSTKQEILMTSFTEDDILSGTSRKMLEVFQRRRVISKGGTD